MTGITRISKESIFSDLNNLEVVTSTSSKYDDVFGFTEEEVFRALDEYDLSTGKKRSGAGMTASLLEIRKIFIIHGRSLIIWTRRRRTPTG